MRVPFQYWPYVEPATPIGHGDVLSDEREQRKIKDEIYRSSALRLTCALTTQPLVVIAVRTMAQFVGGEEKYSGPLDSIAAVIREDGILGEKIMINWIKCCAIVRFKDPVIHARCNMISNNFPGFWKGLIPRCVGEVVLVCLSTAFTYFLNRYIVTEKELQKYVGHMAGFLASSLVYPFQVVSTCMIVSR